jgi:hypothetical protein
MYGEMGILFNNHSYLKRQSKPMQQRFWDALAKIAKARFLATIGKDNTP